MPGKKNSVRSHKGTASKASTALRSKTTSKLTKKFAGCVLCNRKKTSKK